MKDFSPILTRKPMTDKEKIKKRQEEIFELIQAFCSAKLNDEYFKLAEKLLKNSAATATRGAFLKPFILPVFPT